MLASVATQQNVKPAGAENASAAEAAAASKQAFENAANLALLHKETERVAKKQRVCLARTDECIMSLLAEIRGARSRVINLPERHALRHSVQEKNFAGQLASQAVSVKEMLACVGKLGKALDKAFVHTDVCKAKWKDPLHTASLDQVIAQHLFRVGRFDLSEQFSQAASMSVPESLKKPFKSMRAVLYAIQQHNLEPLERWIKDNRVDIESKAGELTQLEFKLRKLGFMRLLCEEGRAEAVQYARRYIAPFAKTEMGEIQRLMAATVFASKLTDSPYKGLLTENNWELVASEFHHICCNLTGQACASPLLTAINAGADALPTLLKLASVLAAKGQDWDRMPQLPLELNLGREYTFHSIFACPVARDQSAPENPPMLLPCGLVLCKNSIQKMAKGNTHTFKCPYCPVETSIASCRQIYF